MLFPDRLVLLRGGGDLATGAAWRLSRAGFPVVATELSTPLAIRRSVAVSSAVAAGRVSIEGMDAVRCDTGAAAVQVARGGAVAVVVDEGRPDIATWALVDARMAKRNIDTTIEDAEVVIGLGPGFTPNRDCHAVIETMRGPQLGRVLWGTTAAPNTGTPGMIAGKSESRVVRAPRAGTVTWAVEIGDQVTEGDLLGSVGEHRVRSTLTGVVRGLIQPGSDVAGGMKIADIDPRGEPILATQISDKALAVGGGVVEAVLTWLNR